MKTASRVLLGGTLGVPTGFIGLNRILYCITSSNKPTTDPEVVTFVVMGLVQFVVFPVIGCLLGAWCAYRIDWRKPEVALITRWSAWCALIAGLINLVFEIDVFARSHAFDFDNSVARFIIGGIVGGAIGMAVGGVIVRVLPKSDAHTVNSALPDSALSGDDVWPPAPHDPAQ